MVLNKDWISITSERDVRKGTFQYDTAHIWTTLSRVVKFCPQIRIIEILINDD